MAFKGTLIPALREAGIRVWICYRCYYKYRFPLIIQ